MLSIYLPIAELSVPLHYLVLLGLLCGVVAGLFGLGGNFFLVPLLIILGIPPSVALSSAIAKTVSSASANLISGWKQRVIDPLLFMWLALGGIVGTWIGSEIFDALNQRAMVETVVPIIHLIVLGYIGTTTLVIHLTKRFFKKKVASKSPKLLITLLSNLPFKYYFPRSQVKISILLMLLCGVTVGMLISVSGIGVGFVLIPVLVYIVKLPTVNAIALSSCETGFTCILATIIHALRSYTVDIVLCIILSIAGVLSVGIGQKIQSKLSSENLDLLFVIIVLSVAAKLVLQLLVNPSNPYSVVIPKI